MLESRIIIANLMGATLAAEVTRGGAQESVLSIIVKTLIVAYTRDVVKILKYADNIVITV